MLNLELLNASQYSEKCSVSGETFESLAKKKELVRLNCGHMFSKKGVAEWNATKTVAEKVLNCPKCNKEITKSTPVLHYDDYTDGSPRVKVTYVIPQSSSLSTLIIPLNMDVKD